MFALELPHTSNCLVCGRGNPHGLRLSLHVDPATGIVTVPYTPMADHIGFEGIIHGGVIATVLDEAMVWAATWAGKRFCVCGELSVRFKESATVGVPLLITARVDLKRSKLIAASGEVARSDGIVLAIATAKYIPLSDERNQQFIKTLVHEAHTAQASDALRNG
jgi:acyl-coenzyme A thioesterase PaaI-like protein